MTRLASIPRHLTGAPPLPTPDPERMVVLGELARLRRLLSQCAARVRCNPASIEQEAKRVEAIVAGLRELADKA